MDFPFPVCARTCTHRANTVALKGNSNISIDLLEADLDLTGMERGECSMAWKSAMY